VVIEVFPVDSVREVWMRSLPVSSLALSTLLAAHVPAAAAQIRSTERADTVARSAQAPAHPGVATLVEEMSIGVADGAEEYTLGNVADVTLGRDGSIYIFDGQVPVVRQYDAAGRFIRRVGRSGSGPGEYRSVSGIATTPDGRLLVWDTGNWRVNVYAANGDFVTQWLTPSGMGSGGTAQYTRALFVDTSGTVIMRKIIFDLRNMENRPTLWLRFRSEGTPLDTIHEPPAPVLASMTARADRVSATAAVPFAPQRLVSMSPGGYLIAAYPTRYAFEIHEPGRPIVSVRRDVKAEPVTRAERADGRRNVEERMRQTDPNWTWNGPDIPATKPLFHDLDLGLDGRIWVRLTPQPRTPVGSVLGGSGVGQGGRRSTQSGADHEPARPSLHDVFEADGKYLGPVQVPAGVSVVHRKGDQVWAVAVGDDDVPRLKRYRIGWRR
jgi:hypothetical protein